MKIVVRQQLKNYNHVFHNVDKERVIVYKMAVANRINNKKIIKMQAVWSVMNAAVSNQIKIVKIVVKIVVNANVVRKNVKNVV